MAVIYLGNTSAQVGNATAAEHTWLSTLLTFRDPDWHWRRSQSEGGDGTIRAYDRIDDTFPAGLVGYVMRAAKAAGAPWSVQDTRVAPLVDPQADRTWLRPYQEDAVQACLKRTRGVIWAATGAGKTEMAVGLAVTVPGVPWLFLAHRGQLADQAAKRYESRTGKVAGRVMEGKWAADPQGFTVATYQSLRSALGLRNPAALAYVASVGGFLADECHTLPAATFRATVMALPQAYYRIGISGTPMAQGDAKSLLLRGATGDVIYRVPAQELIDQGYLAKPRIRMVECPQETEAKTWRGVETELIVKSAQRNRLVGDIAVAAAKPCLLFVKKKPHGRALEKHLRKRGLQVEYVNGDDDLAVRQTAITRLERGDVDVLISTIVMNEGVDVPQLRSVIIASGGSSPIAALQRVGRGMRVVPGKTTFEVWDLWDTGATITSRHTRERVRAYKVEAYEIEIVAPDLTTSVPIPD